MKNPILILFLFILTIAGFGQVPAYHLEKTIGVPAINPTDIAVDSQGNMYILEWRQYRVQKFSATGKLLLRFDFQKTGNAQINEASGLTVDAMGNMYITDRWNSLVQKFDPNGQLLMQFGSQGSNNGQLKAPRGIAVDAQGNIYVADAGNFRVQKFNASGKFLKQIGTGINGNENGQFNTLMDVAVDKAGNIFTVDYHNNVVQKFDSAGQFILKFGQLNKPDGIAVDAEGNIYVANQERLGIHKFNNSGQFLLQVHPQGTSAESGRFTVPMAVGVDAQQSIYLVDHFNRCIQKFSATGQFLTQFWSPSSEPGKFNNPRGITMDAVGNFYIAESGNNRIQKFSATGQFLMQFGAKGVGNGQFDFAEDVALDAYGNIFVAEGGNHRIQKFTSSGKFVMKIGSYGKADGQFDRPAAITVDSVGNIYVADYNNNRIQKFNASGQFLMKFGSRGAENSQLNGILDLALDRKGNIYVADVNNHRIQKFNAKGEFLMKIGSDDGLFHFPTAVAVDDQGTIYVADAGHSQIQQFDSTGRFITKWFEKQTTYTWGIAVSSRKDRIVVFDTFENLAFLFSSSSATSPKENFIRGTIFQDKNSNCIKESEETGIPGIVVAAEPGPYYGISDERGNYAIQIDTGSYTVRQLLPTQAGKTIRQLCPNSSGVHVIRLPSFDSTVVGKNFGNEVELVPFLSTRISSDRRRRCLDNNTVVAYSNTGFAAAPNVKVHVQLPQYVVLKSASQPFTRDSEGNYVFNVGALQPNQSRSITIQDAVICGDESIRGLTVCTKAWITPMNNYTIPADWDRADIAVEARCLDNGFVRFAVKNMGQGSMADSATFRIFLDAQLALAHSYQLAKGDSLVLQVPVNGRTVRLEADQTLNHPRKLQANATVEGCGKNDNGTISTGFVNAMAADDAEPEVSVDCKPIVDSFDPNDKQVTPVGVTAQHYTPTKAELCYQIRFQNTGTDVAYRVVVVDTLSEQLDVATLQVGAASHTYQFAISGKGRPVLTWTFDNINLPDSSHNQAGSNGFVEFSIKAKTNLPEKTKVENFADIFFDFNSGVRTNSVENLLYDVPKQVLASLQLDPEQVITAPIISSVFPAQARLGTPVTLIGRHFATNPANNRVHFNGVLATVTQAGSTSLTVRVPEGAVTGKITVQTPDGVSQSSGDFVVFQVPSLTDFTPKEGVNGSGSPVTLTGTNFSPDVRLDTVSFNGVAGKVISATPTSLTVKIPSGITTGTIRVATLGGFVETSQPFVVWNPPMVDSMNPNQGKAGTMVVLTGEHFAATAARNMVRFGSVMASVQQASPTRLLVQVPHDAQSGKINVLTPGGMAQSTTEFIFLPAPLLVNFAPKRGSAGTVVTLQGINFKVNATQDTVRFNGVAAKILSASTTKLLPFG